MKKSNESLRNLCLAKIKRSTIQPYGNFKFSKFYNDNSHFYELYSDLNLEIRDDELIICSTVIDMNNYSVLTTQRLLTNEKGNKIAKNIEGLALNSIGHFKSTKQEFTLGSVKLSNGEDLKYHIETGSASMVMIQGIKTLLQVNKQ